MDARPGPILIYLLLIISALLAIACNLSGSGTMNQGLRVDTHKNSSSVSGVYQYASDMAGKSVLFSVNPEGQAEFHLAGDPDAPILTVDFSLQDLPFMAWEGATLDGLGALSAEDQRALDNLLDSDLAYALAMIPLDLACLGESTLTPQQLAALLFPLQMRFKYQIYDRAAASRSLGDLSACDFGEAQTEAEADGKPVMIMMTPAHPVPVVMGYFPFDASGAVESAQSNRNQAALACLDQANLPLTSPLGASPFTQPDGIVDDGPVDNEWGPCEAKCRGACGPDCTHNNCRFSIEERCEKNQDGQNSGFFSLVHVYDCGVHPACIKHDACYDECNRNYGCSSWGAAVCMHAGVSDPAAPWAAIFGWDVSCDRTTLNEEGVTNVTDWMQGYGPQPERRVYEYHDKEVAFEYDPITCPLQEEPTEEGPESENDQPRPQADAFIAGTYIGQDIEKPPDWDLVQAEFTIAITEEGVVSGTRVYSIRRESVGPNCSTIYESTHTTHFSGQIVTTEGIISVTTTTENVTDDSSCSWGSYKLKTYETVCDLSLITITGDQLEIVTKASDPGSACGAVFTASRQ